ncbi:MAG: hypothetical protein JXA28_01705 [Bacteroidetes bacterium]|nr:hypothetical protein [Bacteroidota bacterium]
MRSDVQWGNTAERLREALGGLELLPERSPTLAGMLSAVLPGAGYVYAGCPSTGIAALLINGLLAWAVSDAIGEQQYGLAATAAFLGLGWYTGNIIGSANAARAENDMAHRTCINRMLDTEHLQEYRK